MNYWLHPDAEAELEDAALYYAQNASLKIAEAFLAEFEKTLSLILENPSPGTANSLGLCSYHFKHFPYTIIFQKDADGPQIFAVAHQHRKPGYWLQRI